MATASTSKGLTPIERERIVNALDTHIATLKRAMNGKDSHDPELKAIRDKRHAEYSNLRNRIASGELDL